MPIRVSYAHFFPFGGPMALDLCSLRKAILEKLPDHRRTSHGHILHYLEDIVLIALLAISAGCKTYSSFVIFGNAHKQWFSSFLNLSNGIPSADTFRRCLEKVPTDMLSYFLYEWLGVYAHELKNLSLDGKTIRGSKSQSQKARHVLTAYDTDNDESLYEVTVQEKENEITASKELLKVMELEGATVRADAMMCQTEIAALIVEKHGHYCFPVKGNQPTLLADLQLFFESDPQCQTKTIVEKGHGRIETRTYRFATNIRGLDPEKRWKGLKAVGCVTTTTEKNGTITTENQYFITSNADFSHFVTVTRKHWRIENNLHWNLDVVYGEDKSRIKKENAPSNINVLRKVSLCLLQRAKKAIKKYISKDNLLKLCMIDPRNIVKILRGESLA